MSGVRHICVALVSVLLLWGADAAAQIRIIPKEKLDSVARLHCLPGYERHMLFDSTAMRTPLIREDGGTYGCSYRFTNVGAEPVAVLDVVSSCSCARVSFSKAMIKPGESSRIDVEYDPKGHPGRHERRFVVYTTLSSKPTVTLLLTTFVED